MSAQIIALPGSKVKSQPATQTVTAESIIFMGQALIALGRSMAGQPDRTIDPSPFINSAVQCWNEIAQNPVK
jgi:hypothetical protein